MILVRRINFMVLDKRAPTTCALFIFCLSGASPSAGALHRPSAPRTTSR